MLYQLSYAHHIGAGEGYFRRTLQVNLQLRQTGIAAAAAHAQAVAGAAGEEHAVARQAGAGPQRRGYRPPASLAVARQIRCHATQLPDEGLAQAELGGAPQDGVFAYPKAGQLGKQGFAVSQHALDDPPVLLRILAMQHAVSLFV